MARRRAERSSGSWQGEALGEQPVDQEDRHAHQDEGERSRQLGDAPADHGAGEEGARQADGAPQDDLDADQGYGVQVETADGWHEGPPGKWRAQGLAGMYQS